MNLHPQIDYADYTSKSLDPLTYSPSSQVLSGNTSDKNHFREIVKEYGRSLQEKWGEDKIWVWDSAEYSKKNLREISGSYKWIMRVPETLSEAKEILENAECGLLMPKSGIVDFSTAMAVGSK